MKIVALLTLAFFMAIKADAQQLSVDYKKLLKEEQPIKATGKNKVLIITGVMKNKGKLVKLDAKGDVREGKVEATGSTETVSFDLSNIFTSADKELSGKLILTGTKSVGFQYNGEANDDSIATDNTNTVYTGIGYWDALKIYTLLQGDGNEGDILKIINQYSQTQYSSIDQCTSNNDFIKNALLNFKAENFHVNVSKGVEAQSAVGTALSSLSGLDVTQYVQAFADFLRDRIKEELTLAYINKFKERMNSVPEFAYLLPKTINVFNTGDAFSIPSMGATYKTAFAEDLAALPENFERMVYSFDKYAQFRNREDFILFMASYYTIKMSAEKYHPADIFRLIDNKYGFKSEASNNKTSIVISLLNTFSRNLRNASGESWIEKKDIIVLKPAVVNLFLGLLYESNKPLFDASFTIGDKTHTLHQLFAANAADKIFEFVILANNIDQRIKDYKALVIKAGSETDLKSLVMNYFVSNADDIFNLFDFGGNVLAEQANSPELYKYKNLLKNTITLAKGVKTSNLAQVGVNIIAVIKEVTALNNDSATIKELTHYINFITDMVYADSAAKIKQVLQTYAAPPQSYRAIRQSLHTVSIASFPGLYVGYESHSPSYKNQQGKGVFGITAPIGISVGWGNNKKDAGSFALFLSLVDIGAALTYRFNNDSSDLPQKILLGQIFSPGIFGVRGFRRSPLALKLGTQYLPQLRAIKNGNNTINANAWHFSAAICVDIPVLIVSRKN